MFSTYPSCHYTQVDKEDTPCMARLQPVYLNAAVEQMLEMNGYEEFSSYMDTQVCLLFCAACMLFTGRFWNEQLFEVRAVACETRRV